MTLDLDVLLVPERCALVVNECQRGVIGDLSGIPALADSAKHGVIQTVAECRSDGPGAITTIIHSKEAPDIWR
jgi:hypothetical protein